MTQRSIHGLFSAYRRPHVSCRHKRVFNFASIHDGMLSLPEISIQIFLKLILLKGTPIVGVSAIRSTIRILIDILRFSDLSKIDIQTICIIFILNTCVHILTDIFQSYAVSIIWKTFIRLKSVHLTILSSGTGLWGCIIISFLNFS